MTKLRFRMKPGMGVHYLRQNGCEKTVRPGDVIKCTKEEISGALDKFEQIDPDPPPPEPRVGLNAVHRGKGKWDVINEATGKKINDRLLTKEEAQELASSPPKSEPPSARDQIKIITAGKQPSTDEINATLGRK